MTRTRSEYRLSPLTVVAADSDLVAREPTVDDREPLASLLLDAYRGTIDDEGEDLDDARVAVDHALARAERQHSFVVSAEGAPIGFAFVVVVGGRHYVDPVVVAPERKRQGVGRAAVELCLQSLDRVGVTEVGAVITDGNVASERLFLGLGFVRHGPWG